MTSKKDEEPKVYYIGKNYKLYPVYLPQPQNGTKTSTDPNDQLVPPQRHTQRNATEQTNCQSFIKAYDQSYMHQSDPRAKLKQSSTLDKKANQLKETSLKREKLQELSLHSYTQHNNTGPIGYRHQSHVTTDPFYSLQHQMRTNRPGNLHTVKVPSPFVKYTNPPQLKAHEFALRGQNLRTNGDIGPGFYFPGRYSFYKNRARHGDKNSKKIGKGRTTGRKSDLSTCGCVLLVFLCLAVAVLICVVPVLVLIDTLEDKSDSTLDEVYNSTTIPVEIG